MKTQLFEFTERSLVKEFIDSNFNQTLTSKKINISRSTLKNKLDKIIISAGFNSLDEFIKKALKQKVDLKSIPETKVTLIQGSLKSESKNISIVNIHPNNADSHSKAQLVDEIIPSTSKKLTPKVHREEEMINTIKYRLQNTFIPFKSRRVNLFNFLIENGFSVTSVNKFFYKFENGQLEVTYWYEDGEVIKEDSIIVKQKIDSLIYVQIDLKLIHSHNGIFQYILSLFDKDNVSNDIPELKIISKLNSKGFSAVENSSLRLTKKNIPPTLDWNVEIYNLQNKIKIQNSEFLIIGPFGLIDKIDSILKYKF